MPLEVQYQCCNHDGYFHICQVPSNASPWTEAERNAQFFKVLGLSSVTAEFFVRHPPLWDEVIGLTEKALVAMENMDRGGDSDARWDVMTGDRGTFSGRAARETPCHGRSTAPIFFEHSTEVRYGLQQVGRQYLGVLVLLWHYGGQISVKSLLFVGVRCEVVDAICQGRLRGVVSGVKHGGTFGNNFLYWHRDRTFVRGLRGEAGEQIWLSRLILVAALN